MKFTIRIFILATAALLTACTTTPPKPPLANGESFPAIDNKSLNELVLAAATTKTTKYCLKAITTVTQPTSIMNNKENICLDVVEVNQKSKEPAPRSKGRTLIPGNPIRVMPPFAIKAADQTLSKALERWCRLLGCQLIWSVEKDFPVIPAQYNEDFEASIKQVVLDTKRSEYPIRACIYENQVVRIVHASKSCGS